MAATHKAAAAAPALVLTFDFEKDTKNTLRFQEQSDRERPAVGTLYITKDALNEAGLGDIRHLEVTIEAAG